MNSTPTADALHASERLARQLDWSETFWSAWLFTLSPPQAAFVIESLVGSTGRARVLAPRTPQELEGLLPELLLPTSACVIVDAIHGKRSPDGEAWREAWMQLVLRANERREQLRACLTGGLVLVAHVDVKSVVRDAAPDLWSVRTFAFDLPGPPGSNAPIPAIMLDIPTHVGETSEALAGITIDAMFNEASLAAPGHAELAIQRSLKYAEYLGLQGHHDLARSIASSLRPLVESPPMIARALCTVVRSAVMQHDIEGANDVAHELTLVTDSMIANSESLDVLRMSLSCRGMVAAAEGRLRESIDLTNQAIARTNPIRDSFQLAFARLQAGLCHASLGRWMEAIDDLALALEGFCPIHPPGQAKALHCLASTYRALGDPEAARSLIMQAIEIMQPLAERHPTQFRAHLDAMLDELRLVDGEATAAGLRT